MHTDLSLPQKVINTLSEVLFQCEFDEIGRMPTGCRHAVLWNNSVLGEEPIRRHCIERVSDEIVARTVLRTFSLGKSPINPHVKIFSSVLTLQKTRVFYNLCTEENFFRTALFVFRWGFRRLIDLMFRLESEEIEVRFVVSTMRKVSVRSYRLGNPGFIA